MTVTLMTAIWRDVVGYEGLYSVSNTGQIRRAGKYKCLTPYLVTSGRPAVTLCRDGKQTIRLVSTIVAEAFLGPSLGRMVLHWDDCPTHNHLSNLRYGTHQQNMDDRDRNGHTQRGERHAHAKLTEQDVLMIRSSEQTTRALGAVYGVSAMQISLIKRGKTWRHLP